MRPRAAGLAAAGVLLLVPAGASANVSYTGTTDQGRPIELEVADTGLMRFIDVSWRTRRCRGSGRRLSQVTTVREPFDEVSQNSFLWDRTFGRRGAPGVRITIDMALAGRRTTTLGTPAGDRWSGTLAVRAVVRRNGVVTARCRLPQISWSAVRAPDR